MALIVLLTTGLAAALQPRCAVRMQVPASVIPQRTETSEVVVAGATTANVLYGKLQRAAQLPSTRLNPAPIAAVDSVPAQRCSK